MRTALYTFIAILLLLIETVISPHVSLDVLKPELGIPVMLYVTFFLGAGPGLASAVCIGLAEEGLSGAPNGSLLFVTIVIYLIASVMRRKYFVDSKYTFAYFSSGSVIVQSGLFAALTFFAHGETRGILNIAFYMVPNAIITGFASILLFSFIDRLNNILLEKS
ncbi:MAG TPA: rod shape-determining protein MreD [Syntrophorhabdaceae bacterium]|nr:rod shape-determining protein MreD [Syntrophorhabdaceae bacterium]